MFNISSFFIKEVTQLKIAAVISEFNPFHNGHKYLIEKIKNEHADCVVTIMSGSFVQRGDIAITDKYTRAKSAIENGCDLVVELPTVFALSSAQNFAKGGVQIAKALNADKLCFGAENADIKTLIEISEILNSVNFNLKLKEHLSKGEYYPKAVSQALGDICSKEYAGILNGPNNTLAIEYIKALKGSAISPVAIKRKGAQHDSEITSSSIASATHIRKLIHENKDYSSFTDIDIASTTDIKKIESAILYKLRTMSKDELLQLPDVSEGLHNRIFEYSRKSNSLEELYLSIKTKRYTLSRLRRIIMCALIGISSDISDNVAKYVRVLAMNDKGAQIIKNCTTLPIVAKVKKDYEKLDFNAKQMFDIDVRASEIFNLALSNCPQYQNDFSAQIIKK